MYRYLAWITGEPMNYDEYASVGIWKELDSKGLKTRDNYLIAKIASSVFYDSREQ